MTINELDDAIFFWLYFTESKLCKEEWYSISGKCYLFKRVTKRFNRAKDLCSRHKNNGKLFEPKDINHFNLVFEEMKKSGKIGWIGIRKIEGRYVYQSTNLPITFTNWESDPPEDHEGVETCVGISNTETG